MEKNNYPWMGSCLWSRAPFKTNTTSNVFWPFMWSFYIGITKRQVKNIHFWVLLYFKLDFNENVGKSIQKGIFAKRKGSCNGEICCYLEINQENWTYILCKKLHLHAKYWVCIQVNKEANYSVWCNRLVTKSLV